MSRFDRKRRRKAVKAPIVQPAENAVFLSGCVIVRDGAEDLAWCLESFQHEVDEIIVVTRMELLEQVSALATAFSKVRMVVPGGDDRMQSVMNGLREASDKTRLVAVHDGARPLVTDKIIANTIAKAAKFGAAAPK